MLGSLCWRCTAAAWKTRSSNGASWTAAISSRLRMPAQITIVLASHAAGTSTHAVLLMRRCEHDGHVGSNHDDIQETHVQLFRTTPRFCFQSMVWAAADGCGSAGSSTGAGRAACLAALLVNSAACWAPTRSACAPRLGPSPLRRSRCPSDAASAIVDCCLTQIALHQNALEMRCVTRAYSSLQRNWPGLRTAHCDLH